MIQVLHFTNPYKPEENLVRSTARAGQSIHAWLRYHYGDDFTEFEVPTVCQLNGLALKRELWHKRLRDGDNLVFITLPGEPVTIIIAIIAVVVAVSSYLLIPDPAIPNDQTQSGDSVYTLRGQNNRLRPNEPVEVVYGRCRVWPTFICRPYSRYIGNDQYQFTLYCVGQGSYSITDLQLDDTPLDSFGDVEVEVCGPGQNFTLVEGAVYHTLEVSNMELLGPNEVNYLGPSGWFVLNTWDNPIHRIEHDIAFPQGLYVLDNSGKVASQSVRVLFEHQQIDANEVAVGAILTTADVTTTRSDNTPQRVTVSVEVPEGRYRVRAQRITPKPESTRAVTQVRWEDAKSFATFKGNLGDVTVIAMKALATNKLNDQTGQSLNVIAQRLLPKWTEAGGWGPLEATRNPVWAVCDVFRASYGAKIETKYLDMKVLLELALVLEAREDWFDWIFDQQLSVWEVAQTILRVGRSVPIPIGSLVSAVRDRAQSNPTAFFNACNIVQGTLTKKLEMFEFNPFDGLIVEYTDPETWRTKEILCVLEGRAGTNPDRLKMPGCTDRHRAHREGLYIQTRRERQRKTVSFVTGLEGHIPTHFDLIAVTHDTVRIGQGGFIVAYNEATRVLTLSEQITFASSVFVHKIAIRGKDGAISGQPIVCTPGPSANTVVLATAPTEALDLTGDKVPPLYGFGVADLWTFYGQVIAVRPQDSMSVEITCVNYVSSAHSTDGVITPEAVLYPVVQNPISPAVSLVDITPVPDVADRVFVYWPPVAGVEGYMVQTSYDNSSWLPAGTFASPPAQLTVNPGFLWVRVAPFATGVAASYTSSDRYTVGSNIAVPPAPVTTTQTPWTGLTASATWLPVSGATGYAVEIWLVGGVAPLRTLNVGLANFVTYTRAQFLADSPSVNARTLGFRITAFNAGGEGAELIVIQSNAVPVAPVALTRGVPSGTAYPVSWTHTAEEDALEYRVYRSTVSGFTPSPATLVATTTGKTAVIPATVPTYWRVSALDVWGAEEAMSAEATITP